MMTPRNNPNNLFGKKIQAIKNSMSNIVVGSENYIPFSAA
jgi:hypothetical protein